MSGVHASWAQQFHGPPIRVGGSNKVQQTGNCAAETERLDFACDVKSLGFPETTVGRRGVQASAPFYLSTNGTALAPAVTDGARGLQRS